jgi:hypothetical protein
VVTRNAILTPKTHIIFNIVTIYIIRIRYNLIAYEYIVKYMSH